MTRYIGEQDNVRTGTAGVEELKQKTQVPSQYSQKADSSARDPALHQQADPAISQAPRDTAQGKQGAQAMQPEAQQSLEKERRRAEALANELAKAQQIIEMQVARANKARDQATQLSQSTESGMAELRQSLQKEHDRAKALTGELVKARRDLDTHLALSSKAGEEAVQVKKAAESATAELRQSLKKERDRAEAPAPGREPTQPAIARIEVERASNRQIAQVAQAAEAAATEQPAISEAQGSPEATRLLARASALLGQGDIGAARIVLERAVETGSARASFMLAETYDPLVLSTWKTYGTRGNVTKARELYAKAVAGGIQEAKGRSVALD
ncbi:chromosome segregation ATPase [Bradyrhizobium sp. LM2.7]